MFCLTQVNLHNVKKKKEECIDPYQQNHRSTGAVYWSLCSHQHVVLAALLIDTSWRACGHITEHIWFWLTKYLYMRFSVTQITCCVRQQLDFWVRKLFLICLSTAFTFGLMCKHGPGIPLYKFGVGNEFKIGYSTVLWLIPLYNDFNKLRTLDYSERSIYNLENNF